ncbi:MAG: radical SAM protein [Candidatus Heimdallarchaeota archaeon]|nr:radical SAM protein [Candidatus Heimdallarchaeota archaeon]
MSHSQLHEAEYYEILDQEEQSIQCHLCPFECIIEPGETGQCSARKNIAGKLYSLTYGMTDMKIDMIEKQHVYHFFPNSRAQTFATYNCNLDCDYCSMPDKIHMDPETFTGKRFAPDQAVMFGSASGSRVISFGEAEPLISFEWVRDTAKLAKERGLKILIRTNGYFNEQPVREMLEYVDAVTLDIKNLDDEGYSKNCRGGSFDHIKNIIKIIFASGKLMEFHMVIHEGLNNDANAARKFAEWVRDEVSLEVPLHLSRLIPVYRTKDFIPTSKELLEAAYKAAKEVGLHYVYIDGIPEHDTLHTYCPNCNELLIHRNSYATEVRRVSLQGYCNKCQTKLNVVLS